MVIILDNGEGGRQSPREENIIKIINRGESGGKKKAETKTKRIKERKSLGC